MVTSMPSSNSRKLIFRYSQAPKRILSSILQPNSVSFAVLNGCLSFLGVHRYCIGKIRKGDTPLHLAAREGLFLVLRALMDAAKLLPLDIESGIGAEKAMLRLTNKGGDTALHEAVRYNNSEVVKFLIMEDPEFAYSENIDGGTPLYMAAERGFGKLVEIIIDNTRTSPGYTGFTGRTVLHAAVIHKNTGRVRLSVFFFKIFLMKAFLNKDTVKVLLMVFIMVLKTGPDWPVQSVGPPAGHRTGSVRSLDRMETEPGLDRLNRRSNR